MDLFFFVILLLCAKEYSLTNFTMTPGETSLGEEGGSVLLKWEFESENKYIFMKWFRTDAGNNPDSNIMTLSENSVEPVVFGEYKEPTVRAFYEGSASIRITNLVRADEGLIACSIDFDGGSALFQKTNLIVGNKPSDTTVTQPGPVQENTELILICESIAKPAPVITWTNDGVKLNSTTRISITTTEEAVNSKFKTKSQLIFRNVLKTDAGTIICESRNDLSSETATVNLNVLFAPYQTLLSFQFNPGKQGQRNFLLCTADSNPTSITYSIYHEDKMISERPVGNYVFTSVQNYHAGTYTCVPSNHVGEGVNVTRTFTVDVAPEIYESSSNTVIANENEDLEIFCKVLSFPISTMGWSKISGGDSGTLNINTTTILQNSSLILVATAIKLSRLKKQDYGTFMCDASNKFGKASKEIKLVVQYKPQITLHSLTKQNLFLNDSQSTTESCTAIGLPKPDISWYRDNVKIVDGGKHLIETTVLSEDESQYKVQSIISLNTVNKDDSGVLRCLATNIVGEDFKSTSLNIYHRAEINVELSDVTYVNLGSGHSISCVATGVETPIIYWYKDDVLITSGSGNFKIAWSNIDEFSVSSILKINPVTAEDSNAVYKCVANNSRGMDTRQTLISVYFGPRITSFPQSYIVTQEENANYEIVCIVEANPRPTILWYKSDILVSTENSNLFSTDERVILQNNVVSRIKNTLIIKIVNRDNFGNWSCVARNVIARGQSSQTEKKTFLTVTYPPRFEYSSPNPSRVDQSDSVIFICRVKGSPEPFVWWELPAGVTRDERFSSQTSVISDSSQFGSVEDKLSIRNIKRQDVGDYICRTNNTIVSTSKTTRLIVQYPPVVTANFQENSFTVSEKEIDFIEVLVDSNPISTVEWFISKGNGTIYTAITNDVIQTIQVAAVKEYEIKFKSRLLFPNGISRNDNAWFKAVVTNSLGQQDKKTYITIEWKPEPQTKLEEKQDTMLGESPVFLCRFLSNPGSDIEWFKNGQPFTKIGYRTTTLRFNSSMTLSQSVLTFLNVKRDDMGNYSCKAINSIGDSTQWKLLNVLYAPIVPQQKLDILVDPGETLVLDCNADANPPVSMFEWSRDGTPLSISSQKLTQADMNVNSAGLFVCRPGNSLGNEETITFNVTVRIPPTFVEPATCSKDATTSNDIFLCTCAGTGYPIPNVFWTKYPSKEPLSTNNQLSFSVIPSSDGTYYCHLQNSKGDITTSVRIANFVDFVSGWGIWESCNSTCGPGLQERNRLCNVAPCPETLQETRQCSVECKDSQESDDVNWLYALYALIPCAILFFVLVGLWVVRLNRRNDISEQR